MEKKLKKAFRTKYGSLFIIPDNLIEIELEHKPDREIEEPGKSVREYAAYWQVEITTEHSRFIYKLTKEVYEELEQWIEDYEETARYI